MITYNEVYDKRYEKLMEAIAAKNKHVLTCYQGESSPVGNTPGLTIAEYLSDPKRGVKTYLDFVKKINDVVPIDCVNGTFPAYHGIGLSLIWWSRTKMPGKELPPDSVWQTEEKMNVELSDYDLILEKGVDAVTSKLFPKIIDDMGDIKRFLDYQQEEWPRQAYVDAGYPVLRSAGIVCPPFETLCGGRGMNHFFMDCYKILDKVKAVQDVLMEGIMAQAMSIKPSKYTIGVWIGGWRGASSMVNQKIWDELIWPYTKKLAETVSANGVVPIMHIDACWDRDIERFAEIPGQFIVNPDGMTDARKIRKALGKRAVILGDVPVQLLAIASKEDVKDYCRSLLNDIGVEGVILCPGCDAPVNAKFENFIAMYEVAQEF